MKNSLLPLALFCLFVGVFALPPLRFFDATSSAPKSYSNPVIPKENCPDPGIYYDHHEEKYYVSTTTDYNTDPDKFPIHRSHDLVNWESVGHIFPRDRLPTWAVGDFWAPEIHKVGSSYLVYYVARDKTGMLCVGVAYSKNVSGPFKDLGKPLIRDPTVGMIDPTYFYDETTQKSYIIWKEDGNGKVPPEKYTPIWAQPLSDDGFSLEGQRTLILENDPYSWEGPLVEGPWVIKKEGTYFLFYSANGYASDKYAVGVARSSSILGPYAKYSNNPIVHSDSKWSGPGHCAVAQVANGTSSDGNYFMVYHSWVAGQIGGSNPRLLMLDAVVWTQDNWPIIKNQVPSSGQTPVPN